jgi:hypothetical protein
MFHQDVVAKINARFDNCPVECVENGDKGLKVWDINRASFCDDCPHKTALDRFKKEVEEVLKQRLGDKAKHYRFNDLLKTVRRVAMLEETPKSELSVKSSWLLNSYLDERRKFDRMQDANKSKD